MAGPAYYDAQLNISLNEDWIVPFVYGTVDPTSSVFTPIDLTGSTLKLEIRKQETDNEAIVWVASPDQGITITDVMNGAFTIAITRDKSYRLSAGNYVTDFVRLMPNGYQERIFEGTAVVVVGTTR